MRVYALIVLPDDVREPLHSEAGPVERVRHHHVVKKGGVLFPDFVLLVNSLLGLISIESEVSESHKIRKQPCNISMCITAVS